ncbi:putative von Willebrand factor A-like domain superfamily [Helianthus debilis subsp. tardiflorus]
MAGSSTLGPASPEIYRSHQNTTVSPPFSTTTTTSHPFIDAMISHFNSTTLSPTDPPMGYTENNSATYLSTGNPCLDFFFHIVPDTPPQTVTQRLLQSWQHDPLKTLKLVCNLRGVRGTGKSDKEGYYTSVLWLHENHPKTLACMADFGYFKDMPEILYRLLEGGDVRKKAKEEHLKRSRPYRRYNKSKRVGRSRRRSRKEKKSVPREQRVLLEMKRVEIEKVNATHFAELLRSDIKFLANGESQKISLAAKWCPSLDSSFDRSTLLCESIAKKVFPRGEYTEYDGVEEAHYAYRVRDRLRKQVLVPLRKALELPEVYIGQNQWHLIPYNRVASVAMKNYKEKFLKHDTQRFEEYLNNVKSGKAKIAAGALLPHEIISCLEDEDGGQVAELQWNRIVEDMLKKGKLNNCLAICDVSGSMCGTPMEVCVALGVLVSELSEDPWKGKVITFSENPMLETVQGDDLRSKIEFVKTMDWGMNTDFQKVFDLILEVASSGRLSEDEMVKRVFVFSDMEFDQASVNPWETDYQVIKRKFIEKGYGGAMPEMVFWNLRDSRATPVAGKENGVALVSGFSKNLMTLFMEDGGQLNPESVMDSAISGWLINDEKCVLCLYLLFIKYNIRISTAVVLAM